MMPYDPNYAIKQMQKKQQQENQKLQRSHTQNKAMPVHSYHTNELDRQMMPMNNFSDMQANNQNIFSEMQNMHNKMQRKMDKAFSQFDTFGFGKGISREFDMFSGIKNHLDSMFQFSGMHDDIFKNHNGPGLCVQRSYVNSIKMDNDGKKYEEKYFSNNVAQKGKDGNTISERQQAYQNSRNQQQRIAQERMLNNQGRKIVQERFGRNGGVEKTELFYNLDEGNRNAFDQNWNNYDQQIGFLKNNQKYLSGASNYKHIQSEYPQQDYNPFYSQKQTYKDDYRRGDFVPAYSKLPNQPVQYQLQNNYDDEYHGRVRAADLQPTYVGGNPQPLPNNAQAIPLGAPQRQQQQIGRSTRNQAIRNNPGRN